MSSRAAATPCDVAACGARKRGEQIRCRRWCCSGRQRRSSAHPRRLLYKPYNTYIIYQRHNGSPEVVADRRLFRKRLRATYFFNINIFLVGEKKTKKSIISLLSSSANDCRIIIIGDSRRVLCGHVGAERSTIVYFLF